MALLPSQTVNPGLPAKPVSTFQELAKRHDGSTCRVMKSQMKRLGLLKSILQAR
jgi:hypothetical protein